MEKRKLGRSALEFRPIALGGVVFGWTIGEAMSHKLLDGFVDAGFSLVETAESYTFWAPGGKWGESETLIGSWLKNNPGKRDRLLIATKCTVLSRTRLRASVESSLARLNTDYIDLFQSHRDDKDVPLEETLSVLSDPDALAAAGAGPGDEVIVPDVSQIVPSSWITPCSSSSRP